AGAWPSRWPAAPACRCWWSARPLEPGASHRKESAMKFEIRRRGVEVNEELRARIKQGLSAAFARLAGRIGRARAYLGGASVAGKKCGVVVDLPPGGRVVVRGADARVLPLIKRTANRARFAVRRRLKRRLARHRRPRRGDRDRAGGAPSA